MKRQPEVPFAVMSVGEIAVTQVERRTAAEEVRIDEHEVETATVRTAAVQHRQLRGRAEKISLGEADIPGIVAARAREARLGLRAPPIRRNGADCEPPARLGADRVHPHRAKHAEGAQRSLAFLHARAIEDVATVQQQPPPDHPLPRPHVQPVRQMRHPTGRAVLVVEDVAVLDDDRVDGLTDRLTV